jgi:hypothetical protein
MRRRLSAVQNSSSLVAKRLLSAGSGMRFLSFIQTVEVCLQSITWPVAIIVVHEGLHFFLFHGGTPIDFSCRFAILVKRRPVPSPYGSVVVFVLCACLLLQACFVFSNFGSSLLPPKLVASPCLLTVMCRGFTKFNRTDYLKLKAENKVMPDGVNAKVRLCLKFIFASI